MNRMSLSGPILAIGLALTVGAARAETDGMSMGPVYLGHGFFAGAGFRAQSTGLGAHENSMITFNFAGGGFVPVSTVEERMTMFGPHGFVGYRFAPGTLPPWLGANVRVVLSGSWLNGDMRETTAGPTIQDGTPFRFGTLSGTTVSAGTFGGTANTTRFFKANGTEFEIALKATSDFPLTPQLVLTPGIEAFGGRARTEFNHSILDIFNEMFQTNTAIRSRTIGGRLRATLTYWITPAVALHLNGHVAGAHRHAEFDADSCFALVTTFNCNTNVIVSSTLSGSDDRFAFIGGGGLGVSFFAGNAFVIKLSGGATYDSAVPGFRGPVYGPTVGSTGQAARIAFSGRTSFHATARVSILIW